VAVFKIANLISNFFPVQSGDGRDGFVILPSFMLSCSRCRKSGFSPPPPSPPPGPMMLPAAFSGFVFFSWRPRKRRPSALTNLSAWTFRMIIHGALSILRIVMIP